MIGRFLRMDEIDGEKHVSASWEIRSDTFRSRHLELTFANIQTLFAYTAQELSFPLTDACSVIEIDSIIHTNASVELKRSSMSSSSASSKRE